MVDLEERGKALENEYFRRKEGELLARMKERIAAEGSKSLELQCPKCDGSLIQTDFEGVKIDVCDKCSGVWLDAGELADILERHDKDQSWFGKLFG